MREIKFRGKRIHDGQWVVGSLITWPDGDTEICVLEIDAPVNKFSVWPETVGQFTGLKDKYDKEIFEGDTLKRTQYLGGNWIDRVFENYVVSYNSSIAGFEYKPIDGVEYKQYTVRPFGGDEIEIIGSIHEVNPASGQAGVNNMFDPTVKTEGEVNGDVNTQPAEQATETTPESEDQKAAEE